MTACPYCQAEDNTGVFFLCGTDSAVFQQSAECKRRAQGIDRKHCRCGAWVVTETATFSNYECGSSWDEIDGWEFTETCRRNREE